jgi:hypothetical protein
MLTRILSLIYKEILAVWRDKKSRVVLILPPIMQLFVFAFAATLDVKNVPIGILNRDNGKQGFELAQRFHGSPMFTKIIYLNSVDEITPFIDNMRGVMAVSIDEQFSRNLEAFSWFWMGGNPIRLKLSLDIPLQLFSGSTTTLSFRMGLNSKIRSSFPASGSTRICYIIGIIFPV